MEKLFDYLYTRKSMTLIRQMIASGMADHVFEGGRVPRSQGHDELGSNGHTALQIVVLWTAGNMYNLNRLPPERAIPVIKALADGGADRFVTWTFNGYDPVSLPRFAKAVDFYQFYSDFKIPDEVTAPPIEPEVVCSVCAL